MIERANALLKSDADFYFMLNIIDEEIKELRIIESGWLRSRNKQMLATTKWDPQNWGQLTINQKRVAISSLILAVEIHRTEGNPAAPFDPSKVKIIWRDAAS